MPGNSRQLNPLALTAEQVAQILSTAGSRRVTSDVIRKDVDAGAPANANGTINLVHYAAWLAQKEAARGD